MRGLSRLDELLRVFFACAIENVEVGLLVVKIFERRALLLGLDSPQKLDIIQVQAEGAPTSYEKITAAIMSLKYGSNGEPSAAPPDGNGSGGPAAGDTGEAS
jgi:hypothetical protein